MSSNLTDGQTKESKKEFSITYQTLKLLGENLYSNAWSAIAELVANGIDAQADRVFVHITEGKNNRGTLEILDNGSGMTLPDLDSYVIIGYNKRNDQKNNQISAPMGRKGIGKLAALYLSNKYEIITVPQNDEKQYSHWQVNLTNTRDDETPALSRVDDLSLQKTKFETILEEKLFTEERHGTLIRVQDISLKGYAEKAFEGLKHKLADHFSLLNQAPVEIFFARSQQGKKANFEHISKNIASKNFMYFTYSDDDIYKNFKEKYQLSDSVFLNVSESQDKPFQVSAFAMSKSEDSEYPLSGILSNKFLPSTSIETKDLEYKLSGWLGIHASIKVEQASKNDKRFEKNRFYNPSRIRLYVRGKLASDNILPLLSNTKTYVNYVEGEVHFDILDHDDLPDIATTSREGFDESDPRIELLKILLKKQVSTLIAKREQAIAARNREDDQKTAMKQKRAMETLENAIESFDLPKPQHDKVISELQRSMISSNLKTDFKVFISHASKDKPLSDLIYNILRKKGVEREEIFYTSKDMENTSQLDTLTDLEKSIKDTLKNVNTKICYVVADHFHKSNFCLFEAGAGWITRGVDEYHIVASAYDAVPAWLRGQVTIYPIELAKDLSRNSYLMIVKVVNGLIEHINKGRAKDKHVSQIEEKNIPDGEKLELKEKEIEEFFDKDVHESYLAAQSMFKKAEDTTESSLTAAKSSPTA